MGKLHGVHFSLAKAQRAIEDILNAQHIDLSTAFQRPMVDMFDIKSSGNRGCQVIASTARCPTLQPHQSTRMKQLNSPATALVLSAAALSAGAASRRPAPAGSARRHLSI